MNVLSYFPPLILTKQKHIFISGMIIRNTHINRRNKPTQKYDSVKDNNTVNDSPPTHCNDLGDVIIGRDDNLWIVEDGVVIQPH